MTKFMRCEECQRICVRLDLACKMVNSHEFKWYLECAECDEGDVYFLRITEFRSDPVEWLAHLSEKAWFVAEDFVAAVARLRDQRGRK